MARESLYFPRLPIDDPQALAAAVLRARDRYVRSHRQGSMATVSAMILFDALATGIEASGQARAEQTFTRSELREAMAVHPAFEGKAFEETSFNTVPEDLAGQLNGFQHEEDLGGLQRTMVFRGPTKRYRREGQSNRELYLELEITPPLEDAPRPGLVAAAEESTSVATSSSPFTTWPGLAILALAIATVLTVSIFVWRRGQTRLPGTAIPDRPSIAVLPFASIETAPSTSESYDYFGEGVTEAITTQLSEVKGLLVIARDASFRYKEQTADVRKVGRELHVRYLVRGSVQRSGGSLRVFAHVIDTRDGVQLWARRFDGEVRDIFTMQDTISSQIAQSISLRLAAPDSAHVPDLEAYDSYLRALQLSRSNPPDRLAAVKHLEEAIRRDPEFALAHTLLARVCTSIFFSDDPSPQWEQRAFLAVEKALALDPTLPEAYLARGELMWTLARGFPHEAVLTDLRRAERMNPNLPEVHRALARVEMHIGLFDEASRQIDTALRLDPSDEYATMRKAFILLYSGRYPEALKEFDRLQKSDMIPERALALHYAGRHPEAQAAIERIIQGEPDSDRSFSLAVHGVVMAQAGRKEEAERDIAAAISTGNKLGHFHHTEHVVADAYALLGQRERSLEFLRSAAKTGFPCYPLYASDPDLRSLHSYPPFQQFLAELRATRERFLRQAS